MRVQNESRTRRSPPADDFEIVDTQENVYRPIPIDTRSTRSPTSAIDVAAEAPCSRSPSSAAGQGPTQGSLLLFKLKTDSLQNRPLSCSSAPAAAGQTGTSTSTSRTSAPDGAPRIDLLRRGRGGLAAGALADEQHADRHARVAGGREGGEPGVGVGRCPPPAAAAPGPRAGRVLADRRAQLGGAGLAGHRDARDRGADAGAAGDHGAHGAPHEAGDARLGSRAPAAASVALEQRRARALPALADRRRDLSAICSGVVSTLPWPIAVEPTARSSPISPAAGIVERAAPASFGSSLKPKRSAAATSRSAPSLAPSGAKTELQESANDVVSEPPHASPLAFSSSTPSSVAAVCTGKLVAALDDARVERARRA